MSCDLRGKHPRATGDVESFQTGSLTEGGSGVVSDYSHDRRGRHAPPRPRIATGDERGLIRAPPMDLDGNFNLDES